jgi:TPR repeat protein
MLRGLWIPCLLLSASLFAQSGLIEGMQAYERGDFEEAMIRWRPLAEDGSPEAQFNVGLLYAKGLGVDADSREAARWYELAAEQDFAQAQYNLAKLYQAGDGVPRDLSLAYVWFKLAGASKYADARKRRKKVARELTPHELAQADLLAREWKRKRESAD